MTIDLEHFPHDSDVEFVKALLREESVYVMPGKVSGRLVLIVTFDLPPLPTSRHSWHRPHFVWCSFCRTRRSQRLAGGSLLFAQDITLPKLFYWCFIRLFISQLVFYTLFIGQLVYHGAPPSRYHVTTSCVYCVCVLIIKLCAALHYEQSACCGQFE